MKQDIFQAIADPTRRAILTLIAVQALTPNAMAEKFDTSRQAVSKHLKVLQECELIKPKPSGREIYYHLNRIRIKIWGVREKYVILEDINWIFGTDVFK